MADPKMVLAPVVPEDRESCYRMAGALREQDNHDLELAVFWLARAARRGHAEAMFTLGRMIDSGEGPVRDAAQAAAWYRRAAAAGHRGAQEELAARPPQPQSDLEKAIAGDGRSQYQMGFSHFMGTGSPKSYVQSYFWFKVLEKTMPPQAAQMLQMLAGRLDAGTRAQLDEIVQAWTPGTPPPSPELEELREAATLEDPEACYTLARALAATGTSDARAEALEWFVWAARKGYVPAHFALAYHYHDVGDEAAAELHVQLAGSEPALKLLAEGAARGINSCRYQLAGRLVQGRGAEPDPARSAALYCAAADSGHVPSMAKAGACYFNGYGVERDLEQAEHWLAEGAKHEDVEALYSLGAIRRNRGLGVLRNVVMAPGALGPALQDLEDSVGLLTRAAEKGHVSAMYLLALAYGEGDGAFQDLDKMGRLIRQAAEGGHVEAQYLAGNYCAEGAAGFAQDDARAVYWYEAAAKRQHPGALYRLGAHIFYGRGAGQDFQRAWDLTEQAARLGNDDAMVALGVMVESGEGPENDPELALDWYQKAAKKGNAEGQYRMGQRLADGGNPDYARPFLEQAAAQGHEKAQSLIEALDEEKKAAAARNRQTAPQWSNDPASKAIAGDANAQFQLGFAHYSGAGAPQSLALSYFWLKIAERSMPMAVGQMLQAIGAQLGARREEWDALAAAWTPGTSPPAG